MIRILNLNACSDFKKQLIEIWQEAFLDSEDYIGTFMREVGAYTKVVVCEVEGRIVSATYLLPVSYIQNDNTTLDCYYLYAAATLQPYRGRGYFGEILKFVKEHIHEPVVLVPASRSLVEYYREHNFQVWLTEEQDAIEKFKQAKTNPISKDEYLRFRKEVFYKPYSMLWGDAMMDYICKEHEQAHGMFEETFINDTRVLFMCLGEGKDWNILEMVSEDAKFRIWPTVMANKAFFEPEKGYFNLTMG